MKIGDKVILVQTTEHYSRGVVGSTYKIAEILKTEIKLCSGVDPDLSHCFYTHPNNVMHSSIANSTGSDYDIDKPKTESEAFAADLDAMIKNITDLLKSKNKAYGNSALKPAKIFSQLDATESLCARIDDKLMRIKNRGITDATEDTVDDLIGYLLLLKMSM
tara:strand:+ start:420 stop:905 length:486 start_codon:yes stop_codon:yes gene_type:complete